MSIFGWKMSDVQLLFQALGSCSWLTFEQAFIIQDIDNNKNRTYMITIVKLILSVYHELYRLVEISLVCKHAQDIFYNYQEHTINEETFVGLNFHSSIPMKYFTGTLSQCIGQKHCMVIVIIPKITEALIFFVE